MDHSSVGATNPLLDVHNLLDRIKNAADRSTILAVFDEFSKQIHPSCDPDALRLLSIAFLDKLSPPLFGLITDSEFSALFVRSLLLDSPHPALTLTTLIHHLSSVPAEDAFKLAKVVNLLELTQQTLLRNALLDDRQTDDPNELAFALASFPDRVYRHSSASSITNSIQQIGQIVANFEDNLLNTLLDTFNSSSADRVNLTLCAQILTDYNSVSAELTQRFICSVLEQPRLHPLLRQIVTQPVGSRRRRDEFFGNLVSIAPDGHALQLIFGDLVLRSDHSSSLQRLLASSKLLLQPAIAKFGTNRRRNSEKIAHFLALADPAHLATAFLALINQFMDHCKVAELVSINAHFQLALALVDFARRLSTEQVATMRDELMYLLVPTVPQMIEMADCSRRQIGMFMAQTLFELFEFPSPPKFDYYEKDPVLAEFRMAIVGGSKTNVTEEKEEEEERMKRTENGKMKREKKTTDVRVAILDSDDEDDEQREEDDGGGKKQPDGNDAFPEDSDDDDGPSHAPAYLRDCLELLSASASSAASSSADWRRWRAALRAVPRLLRRKALGWDTLAQDLLDTVVALDNRYNLAEFGELRSDILRLIVAQRPELVSHVCRLVSTPSFPLIQRHTLVAALVEAARLLAHGNDGKSEENGRNRSIRKIDRPPTSKEDEENDGRKRPGPKVVWRSALLDKQRAGTAATNGDGCRENAFARVAPQFVFPLINADRVQDRLLRAKLIWAVGELLSCAVHSPSIVRILSAVFLWLDSSVRDAAPADPLLFRSCLCCYAHACDTLTPELLRTHFWDELHSCYEWLAAASRNFQGPDADETVRQCIGVLSLKLAQTLAPAEEVDIAAAAVPAPSRS